MLATSETTSCPSQDTDINEIHYTYQSPRAKHKTQYQIIHKIYSSLWRTWYPWAMHTMPKRYLILGMRIGDDKGPKEKYKRVVCAFAVLLSDPFHPSQSPSTVLIHHTKTCTASHSSVPIMKIITKRSHFNGLGPLGEFGSSISSFRPIDSSNFPLGSICEP